MWELIKKGNISSASAAVGNLVLTIIKGSAAYISGSGTMFASAMHTAADTVNQGFVFIGSVVSELPPSRKFPTGFGRLINIFCMVAVVVVTIMAYETIKEGIHLLKEPVKAKGFLLNTIVLGISIIVDGVVLMKAMKEIMRETRVEATGFGIVPAAFSSVKLAAPPTRLVFYEDLVATSGAGLALIAVIIAEYTTFTTFDGIATILIGLLMLGVGFKLGYDNMVGLIGVAAPSIIEDKISKIILIDHDVTDINRMRILQEGRFYHVEGIIELRTGLTLAEADDIKARVKNTLLNDHDISDVILGIIEDNGVINWSKDKHMLDLL